MLSGRCITQAWFLSSSRHLPCLGSATTQHPAVTGLERTIPKKCNSCLSVWQSLQKSATAKQPVITSLGHRQTARGGDLISFLGRGWLPWARLSAKGQGLSLCSVPPLPHSALLSPSWGLGPSGSCLLSKLLLLQAWGQSSDSRASSVLVNRVHRGPPPCVRQRSVGPACTPVRLWESQPSFTPGGLPAPQSSSSCPGSSLMG